MNIPNIGPGSLINALLGKTEGGFGGLFESFLQNIKGALGEGELTTDTLSEFPAEIIASLEDLRAALSEDLNLNDKQINSLLASLDKQLFAAGVSQHSNIKNPLNAKNSVEQLTIAYTNAGFSPEEAKAKAESTIAALEAIKQTISNFVDKLNEVASSETVNKTAATKTATFEISVTKEITVSYLFKAFNAISQVDGVANSAEAEEILQNILTGKPLKEALINKDDILMRIRLSKAVEKIMVEEGVTLEAIATGSIEFTEVKAILEQFNLEPEQVIEFAKVKLAIQEGNKKLAALAVPETANLPEVENSSDVKPLDARKLPQFPKANTVLESIAKNVETEKVVKENIKTEAEANVQKTTVNEAVKSLTPAQKALEDAFAPKHNVLAETAKIIAKNNAANRIENMSSNLEQMVEKANKVDNDIAKKPTPATPRSFELVNVQTPIVGRNVLQVNVNAEGQLVLTNSGVKDDEIIIDTENAERFEQFLHKVSGSSGKEEHVNQLAKTATKAMVGEQVSVAMRKLTNNGGGQVKIQLNPEELGRVDISLTIKDGKVHGVISAQNSEVVEQLARDLRHLQQSLQNAGLEIGKEGFSFMLSDDANKQFAQDNKGNNSNGDKFEKAMNGEDITETETVATNTKWKNPNRILDVNI